MKNVFKMLGIALFACSLFVACGEDTVTYKITVKANPADAGTVTGGGKYESGATATLEATANAGYNFVEWSDGVKNNPRLVTVTADAEYTANFAVQSGVNVTFGEATWNAEYINAMTNGSAYMIAASQNANGSKPYIELYSSSLATGTTSSTPSVDLSAGTASVGDPYLHYYLGESGYNWSDGSEIADWWANDLTVNVSAYDADAMTISLVANGTAKLFPDFDESKVLTVTVSNVQMTAAKAAFAAHNGKFIKL